MKIHTIFLFAITISIALFNISCSKPPTAPSSKPFFSAFLIADDNYWDGANEQFVAADNIQYDLYSYNAPKARSLSLTINGTSPSIIIRNASEKYWYDCIYSCGIFLNESFGGIKNVTISSDLGSATGSIEIPNPTVITSHNDQDSVSPYSSVVLTWNCNADFYSINVTMWDTGYGVDFSTLIDTTITGTSYTISASLITPSAYRLEIQVTGINGVQPLQGASGNLSGDGQGFIFVENQSGPSNNSYISLYFRGRHPNPQPLSKVKVKNDSNDLQQKIIRKLIESGITKGY